MFECIIFDIDGTLIDTENVIITSLQKVLKEEVGADYQYDDLDFVLGVPGENSLKTLKVPDVQRALKKWDEQLKNNHHLMKVYPEIKEVLEVLTKRGIKTGIVTSKSKQEFIDDFEPFGLCEYLPYVITADDTERHKPDPQPLLKFLEIASVEADKAVYVGDTLYDYECARQAGIPFALAQWGSKNPGEIDARVKLKSPRELLTVVFREERVETIGYTL